MDATEFRHQVLLAQRAYKNRENKEAYKKAKEIVFAMPSRPEILDSIRKTGTTSFGPFKYTPPLGMSTKVLNNCVHELVVGKYNGCLYVMFGPCEETGMEEARLHVKKYL